MKGKRLADTKFGDLPDGWEDPGAYWKVLDRETGEPKVSEEPGNLTGGVWHVHSPAGGVALLTKHTVREEEDGTISVRPGDGSSNSILITGPGDAGTFHGYIEHGVWSSV